MALFELQACVGNNKIIIANTDVVANNPPRSKNKGRYYFKAITSNKLSNKLFL